MKPGCRLTVGRRARGWAGGLLAACTGVLLSACGAEAPADDATSEGAPDAVVGDAAPTLGPVDGRELPGADLERVAVGDVAPDFQLMSYRGDVLTLSENHGEREVLLVFYRGHW
ncbi:MAG TPA: hypothetical protein VJ925_14385 [Longimicrobiales bacterium]|nr:hypothetical protein [Longimicrobiales bacterium]